MVHWSPHPLRQGAADTIPQPGKAGFGFVVGGAMCRVQRWDVYNFLVASLVYAFISQDLLLKHVFYVKGILPKLWHVTTSKFFSIEHGRHTVQHPTPFVNDPCVPLMDQPCLVNWWWDRGLHVPEAGQDLAYLNMFDSHWSSCIIFMS